MPGECLFGGVFLEAGSLCKPLIIYSLRRIPKGDSDIKLLGGADLKEEKSMKLARWKTLAGSLFLAAVLSVPAWGADTDNRHNAVPGTLNYVEGQASIDNQTLDSKSVGDAELQNGQILETGNGKAEILLTPGVYLRIGDNSSVKMVSANLTNTQLALDRGQAMLEVDQIYP